MTVRVYKSTDDGAPVLNGLAGSLITVLDAVLVNGYGTMAAAGWTKPFSGTNKAVYRSATANGGSGLYYRVYDLGVFNYLTTSGTATRIAAVRGFESMTTVDSGTNAYPLTANKSDNYFVWQKSSSNDSGARDWIIIADQYTAHILINTTGNLTTTGYQMYSIGEFYSYVPNFAWKGYIFAETNSETIWSLINNNVNNSPSFYAPRKYDATIATSGNYGAFVSAAPINGGLSGTVGVYGTANVPAYPHPVDGKLHQSKIFIGTNSVVPLGYLRGLYAPLHRRPLQNGDIFYGTGSLSGKTFQVFKIANSSNADGQINIEISDTWAYSV